MTSLLSKISRQTVSESDVIKFIKIETINDRNDRGESALWIACARSKDPKFERIAIQLLNSGANPHFAPKGLYPPILLAAQQGKEDLLQCFIERKVPVDTRWGPDGITPLILAAHDGHFRICKLLLENGAQPNLHNDKGATALHAVVQGTRSIAVAKLLLDSGAELRADRANITPLHQIYKGKKPDYTSHVLSLLLLDKATKPLLDRQPPFLGYAIRHGTDDVVKKALDKGADPNISFLLGPQKIPVPPMVLALEANNGKMMQYLVEKGASATAQLGGVGLFCWAAECNALNALEYLLSLDIDPNQRNDAGQSACYVACVTGHLLFLERLLSDPRVAPGLQANDGATALHVAADSGFLEACELLCHTGINYDAKLTTDGATSLMVAAQNGHTAVVRYLLSLGADYTPKRSCDGLNAISLACRYGHLQTVEEFLEKGRYNEYEKRYARSVCWLSINPLKGAKMLAELFGHEKDEFEARFSMLQIQSEPKKTDEEQVQERLANIQIQPDPLIAKSAQREPKEVPKRPVEHHSYSFAASTPVMSGRAFLKNELGLAEEQIRKLKEGRMNPKEIQPAKKSVKNVPHTWAGGKFSTHMPEVMKIESSTTPNCFLYLDMKSLEEYGFEDQILLEKFPLRFCARHNEQGIKTLTENVQQVSVTVGNKIIKTSLRYELKVTSSGCRILGYPIEEGGKTLIVGAIFINKHDRLDLAASRIKKLHLSFPEPAPS